IAVSADAQIRQLFGAKGFFSEQQPNYHQLLVNYAQAAKNIVDNLNRQSPMFDDKEYVEGYMIATLQSVYKDFSQYKPRIAGRYGEHSSCVELINKTLDWVQSFDLKLENLSESDDEMKITF
ncbi:TPA: lpg1171 family Dot/Icm T4SS effector, partial [Legionella pneumophila]|nr:lpg1171 family Dot/Icm T4SS effector [Legionella pneumophila]